MIEIKYLNGWDDVRQSSFEKINELVKAVNELNERVETLYTITNYTQLFPYSNEMVPPWK